MTEEQNIDAMVGMKLFPCPKCGNLYCLKMDATYTKDNQFQFRIECSNPKCREFLGHIPIFQNRKDFINEVREKYNKLFKILQNKPEDMKLGYQKNVPSILNAYREGDIPFEKAVELLQIKNDPVITKSNDKDVHIKGKYYLQHYHSDYKDLYYGLEHWDGMNSCQEVFSPIGYLFSENEAFGEDSLDFDSTYVFEVDVRIHKMTKTEEKKWMERERK